MKDNANCIAIYSRKSKFTKKGESIENQVELCRAYIHSNYPNVPEENILVFEDEGFSGGNLNRPDFKKMMDTAREKKLRAIIVYRLDRISRNISDFSSLIEELSRLEIAFVSLREQFDTETPMGRAMMYIASVFSQLERETIAERIRDNMHELAKTGRWLGGTTPTGYASESVEKITIDGKAKKSCKLKLLPEEAEHIKLIFRLYAEYDSLTKTECELIRRGVKSKNSRHFSRFTIRSILQNPVYMIADDDAYRYLIEKDVDLFSEKEAFDGVHGIMAYNRTSQQRGKATVYLPPSSWIVSVGEHPGLISGKDWIATQESLNRNKQKGYRKPRINEALLTGLLYCKCGSRMYPKLDSRRTVNGKPVYTYICHAKKVSQKALCDNKNVNGTQLDIAILEQLKLLEDDQGSFIRQLEASRKFYTGNKDLYEKQLSSLQKEKQANERKIEGLIDSLADLGQSTARTHVTKRIEQLNQEGIEIDARIQELEGLIEQKSLSDMEFGIMRQLLSVFKNSIDEMSVEQKRAAIRTLVRKIIWDGTNAHLILFGVQDDEVEYPSLSHLISGTDSELKDHDLQDFSAADDEEAADGDSKTPWGEYSE